MTTAAFLPPLDPFGRTAPLAFEFDMPVLGVPIRCRSNAAQAIAHAAEVFGAWADLPASLVGRGPAACFDIVVHPRTDEPLPRLSYRRHGAVFLAGSSTVMGAMHLDTGQATMFVPAQALDDGEWFRSNVLGLAWTLASRRQRVPLHAAVVVGAARALLLLGDSGLGKSTLAYACARAGMRVLTEDTVFVDLSAGDDQARLWGALPCHWLSPETSAFFTELGAHRVVLRGNGKHRLRVPTVDGPPLLTCDAPVTAVCLVDDGDHARVTSTDGDVVADMVEADRTQGFDQYPESRPGVVAWLRTRPACRCVRGNDPRATAALLVALSATAASETPASLCQPEAAPIP